MPQPNLPEAPADVAERARAWLAEDAAFDDVTAQALVPARTLGMASIRAKEAGVVAGLGVAAAVFHAADPAIVFRGLVADGARVLPGDAVAELSGPARGLLAGERTALNVLQRMSGVATHTRAFVEAVRGTGATILVTRKTMPGLRELDLLAVRAGGGDAHRRSLADRVLVKENHVAAARSAGWAHSMADVAARLTGPGGPDVPIGIEVRDLHELRQALVRGVAVVLVDNFTPDLCREAVRIRDEVCRGPGSPADAGPAIEASGGITLENVRAFAESGVERISVGAPTHSSTALDLSMLLDVSAGDAPSVDAEPAG